MGIGVGVGGGVCVGVGVGVGVGVAKALAGAINEVTKVHTIAIAINNPTKLENFLFI